MLDIPHSRLAAPLNLETTRHTEAFAAATAQWLLSLDKTGRHGATIGLCGTLGAGKTLFVQAMLASLGVDRSTITSPTFSLIQTYKIATKAQPSCVVHHLDAYRIRDLDEFLELGVEELLETPRSICLIEWADKVADVLPDNTLWFEFEWVTEHRRKLFVRGIPAWKSPVANLIGSLITE